MPASHTYQINEIMEASIRVDPKKVLDIGTGFGKYGVLLRERLDIWRGGDTLSPYLKENWTTEILGVEAYPDYITPIHHFVYDKVIIGLCLDILPKFPDNRFDLAIMIDALEHLDLEDGRRTLKEMCRVSKNSIISVPKIIGVQGTVFGNTHEAHLTSWKESFFNELNLPNLFYIKNRFSIIACFGIDCQRIWREMSCEIYK